MENQLDYNSVDFDYDCNQNFNEDVATKYNIDDVKDILKNDSTESLSVESDGLKPTREIIRGSVIYEDGNDN